MEKIVFSSSGVVLRVNLYNKLYILDSKLGKISCILKYNKLSLRLVNGAYISYNLKEYYNQYNISDIDILDIPNHQLHNLYFLHHILELCYYFLPINYSANISQVFDLILHLYKYNIIFDRSLVKKIFLCKFFKMIGIYPDDFLSYDKDFIKLIDQNYFNIIDIENNLNLDINLMRWLLSCINLHPHSHRLKTINFLKELDINEYRN